MPIYKDVSSLELVTYVVQNDLTFDDGVDYILEKLDAIPEADVEPVRHGHWVKKKHLIPLALDSSPFIWANYDEETHSEWKEFWHCSECDYEAGRDMKPIFKYCHNCGAKMDEEEEKEQ